MRRSHKNTILVLTIAVCVLGIAFVLDQRPSERERSEGSAGAQQEAQAEHELPASQELPARDNRHAIADDAIAGGQAERPVDVSNEDAGTSLLSYGSTELLPGVTLQDLLENQRGLNLDFDQTLAANGKLGALAGELAKRSLLEDPSLRSQAMSRDEAVELANLGILILQTRSADGAAIYFQCPSQYTSALLELQSGSMALSWSDTTIDRMKEDLLGKLGETHPEGTYGFSEKADGTGFDVVDGDGHVVSSCYFVVPGRPY